MKVNKTLIRVYLPLVLTLLIVLGVAGKYVYSIYFINQNKGTTKTFWRDFEYKPYNLLFSLPPSFMLEHIDTEDRYPLKMTAPEMQIKIRKLPSMGKLILPGEEIQMLNSMLEIDFQKYLMGFEGYASNFKFYEYSIPNRKAVVLSSQIDLRERDKTGQMLRQVYPIDVPKEWGIKRGSTYFLNQVFILWGDEILVVQVTSPKVLTDDQLSTLNQILLKLNSATSQPSNAPRQE